MTGVALRNPENGLGCAVPAYHPATFRYLSYVRPVPPHYRLSGLWQHSYITPPASSEYQTIYERHYLLRRKPQKYYPPWQDPVDASPARRDGFLEPAEEKATKSGRPTPFGSAGRDVLQGFWR